MNKEVKYVFQFRGAIRRELCSILDVNEKWRELASRMGYSVRMVEEINKTAKNNSPSDVLLEHWGQQAPTMHKLFTMLSEMQHYQALVLLKNYVPEELHILIYEGEENLDSEDNENGQGAEGASSSDSDSLINQNTKSPKKLHSKFSDNETATTMSIPNNNVIYRPPSSYAGENGSPKLDNQRPQAKLLEQQQDHQELPLIDPRTSPNESHSSVRDMFHRNITEADNAVKVTQMSMPHTHRELTVSVPPSCFVPPMDLIVVETPSVPQCPQAFSLCSEQMHVTLLPQFDSAPCSQNTPSDVACPGASPLTSISSQQRTNEAVPGAEALPSIINTSHAASGPPRRQIGSSLASKKLILGEF